MAGMAGLLAMNSRNDSKTTLTARREALARLKKREMDTPTRVFGEAAKAVLPDVGVLNRAVRDPIGTAKGVAEVASLVSPAANAYRAYKLATGDGFSVTGADMQDVEQAMEVAGVIPQGKSAALPAKFGVNLFERGIVGAARRTTPDMLSAASGGIVRGTPKIVSQARKIIPETVDQSSIPIKTGRLTGSSRQKEKAGRKVLEGNKVVETGETPLYKDAPAQGEVFSIKDEPRIKQQVEEQLLGLRLHDRLSKRARETGSDFVFSWKDRAAQRVFNKQDRLGRELSLDEITQINKEEQRRNDKEYRRIIEAAKANYPDEYAQAYDSNGVQGVLDMFDLAHIQPLANSGRIEWSNVRLIPRRLHVQQGTQPWKTLGQTLVQ